MFALFEDRLAPVGGTAAWLFDHLVSTVEGDWPTLNSAIDQAKASGNWAVAALRYELGEVFEPTVSNFSTLAASKGGNQGVGRVWVFARRQVLDGQSAGEFLNHQARLLEPSQQIAGIGGLAAQWSEQEHAEAVKQVQSYIRSGDCYQVNLTFPLDFSYFGHPLALYLALREQQPVAYGALILDSKAPVLSLSPELFVDKKNDLLLTRPMKGTSARSNDSVVDQQNAADLAMSAKNRAENLMIVDLLRNDLSRLKINGHGEEGELGLAQIRVSELFTVEAYPSVWQMVSQVECRLPAGQGKQLSPGSLLGALFPCGSITGAPKVRAMQIIKELEPRPRREYTGSIGWFAPNGDCRLNVAIRTLALTPAKSCGMGQEYAAYGSGTLGVGGGIVQDSIPADEWNECWLKARFLTQLDPKIRLIETLRLENGFPLLERHLERLQRSAEWLGFICDLHPIRQRLLALAAEILEGVWRVRLTLGKVGDVDLQAFPLIPEPVGVRRLTFSSHRIDADHPLQTHKTTWRQHYDEALAGIAETPEVFDVLFLNKQEEVVEGARSSIFVLQNGVWKTPPLRSGALPGVWRSEVLSGRVAGMENVQESDLRLADVKTAERIVCGNALRGGIEVCL